MNLIDLGVLSEKRRDILLLIQKKQGSFEEIAGLLDISPKSLRIQIKKLLDSGLLEEERGEYKLSDMAVPIVENLKELMGLLAFFEKNIDYLKNHDLSPIPDFLLRRLEELDRFELVETDESHVFEIPQSVMENLRESKEIFAFFSCLHPEIPSLYSEFAGKGLKLSLCVTDSIAERLLKDFLIETQILLGAENTKISVCSRDVNLPVFVVTDRFIAIGLSQNNGRPGSQLITCTEDRALYWGRELYKYYEGASEPFQG
jgi:predicted transcriptional regulator